MYQAVPGSKKRATKKTQFLPLRIYDLIGEVGKKAFIGCTTM